MKINQNNSNKNKKSAYNISAKGSLGLLAYGDIGLREWRKVKKEFLNKDSE